MPVSGPSQKYAYALGEQFTHRVLIQLVANLEEIA